MFSSRKVAIFIVSVLLLMQCVSAAEPVQETPVAPQAQPVQIPAVFVGQTENSCKVDAPCENAEAAKEADVKKPKVKKRKFWWVYSFLQINPDAKKPEKKIDIEKYMNLSEEQIKSAQQNRLEGEEKIKPYLDEIEIREKKIENIEFKNIPDDARDKQVERYKNEIKAINLEADKIRLENTENFEKILTPEQLKLFQDAAKEDHFAF